MVYRFTEGDGAILESKGKLKRIRHSPQLVILIASSLRCRARHRY